MKIRLYFNKKAWEAAAKQLRSASWAVSGTVTIAGLPMHVGWTSLAGIVLWFTAQSLAFMLESVEHYD